MCLAAQCPPEGGRYTKRKEFDDAKFCLAGFTACGFWIRSWMRRFREIRVAQYRCPVKGQRPADDHFVRPAILGYRCRHWRDRGARKHGEGPLLRFSHQRPKI